MALIVVSLLIFPHILYGLPVAVKEVQKKLVEGNPKGKKIEKKGSEIPKDTAYFLEIKAQIERYLREEKPYLSKQFKMADIIVKTGAPQHHIAYCMNYYIKKSLPELKTEYRISWAKKALADPEHQSNTIEAIGIKAGYSSKSAFFKAFKDYTGITPQEYQKQALVG
jgi:AraC-like DNA-binding protein